MLTSRETYDPHPEDAWKRLKMRVRKPQELAVLQAVAAWREREARERNVPRGRVLKDDAIYEIAQQQPRDAAALSRLRTTPKGWERSATATALLGASTRRLPCRRSRCRRLPKPAAGAGRLECRGGTAQGGAPARRRARGRRGQGAGASADDIDRIAADGEEADVPALQGWRREVFGETGAAAGARRDRDQVRQAQDRRVRTLRPRAPALTAVKAQALEDCHLSAARCGEESMVSRRTVLGLGVAAGATTLAGGAVHSAFRAEMDRAEARIATGRTTIPTRSGTMEYAEKGTGRPILMIHGTGGGFDQGLHFAAPLVTAGYRVIAPSRFGYLGSDFPADAGTAAQADAFVDLLDALGIERLPVAGGSAGALPRSSSPSAIPTAAARWSPSYRRPMRPTGRPTRR